MGTEYVILKKDDLEIALDEMSNKFSLDLVPLKVGDYGASTSTTITPEELVGMALEMLKTASYFLPGAEIEEAVLAHLHDKRDKGYYAGIVGQLVRGGINAIAGAEPKTL